MNDALEAARWSLAKLARHIGMTAETLRRKRRGEAWISWADAATLILAFPDSHIMPRHPVAVPEPPADRPVKGRWT